MGDSKILITLINGTFAPNASWIKSGSSLASWLTKNLPNAPSVHSFSWRGQNKVRARLTAARDLKLHVESLKAQHEQSGEKVAHYLIGHSHGGNVALYAYAQLKNKDDIDGIICLSTPFLHFWSNRSVNTMSFLARCALTIIIFVFMKGILSDIHKDYGDNFSDEVSWAAFLLSQSLNLLIWFVFFILYRVSNDASLSFKQRIYDAELPHIPSKKFLSVRTIGDEASGLLGAASLINWISIRVATIPYRIVTVFGALFLVLAYLPVLMGPMMFGYDVDFGAAIIMSTVGIVLGLPFLLGVLRLFCTALYGFDIPFHYPNCLVSAETTPNTGSYESVLVEPISSNAAEYYDPHTEEVVVLDRWEGLKHSEIYDNTDCLKIISSWISAKQDRR